MEREIPFIKNIATFRDDNVTAMLGTRLPGKE